MEAEAVALVVEAGESRCCMKRCIRCNHRVRTLVLIVGSVEMGYVCRDPGKCERGRARKGKSKGAK